MLQRVGAAGDAVDGEAGLAKALLQIDAGFGFVFGDQQFHREHPHLGLASLQRHVSSDQQLTET